MPLARLDPQRTTQVLIQGDVQLTTRVVKLLQHFIVDCRKDMLQTRPNAFTANTVKNHVRGLLIFVKLEHNP